MKKLLSLIFIFYILALTGCGTSPKAGDKASENTSSSEIIQTENTATDESLQSEDDTQEDDSWKYEVAQRLYDEFCYFYEHKDDDMSNDEYYIGYRTPSPYHSYVNYNVIMAADRANGIAVYKNFLPKEKVEYVRSKSKELNDVIGSMEILKSGYSKSGLHYMAIVDEYTTNAYYSSPSCDKIRGDTSECDLITDLRWDASISVFDLYVEDLANKKQTIDIDIDLIYYDFNIIKKPKLLPYEANDMLEKYGRKNITNSTTQVKNKSWNLYCYEHAIAPDNIKITSYGEETILSNQIVF